MPDWLIPRKKGHRVAETLEYLFDTLKYSLLFRIFLGVAEEYLPAGQCLDLLLQAFLARQHTGWHDPLLSRIKQGSKTARLFQGQTTLFAEVSQRDEDRARRSQSTTSWLGQ
jgi:hypothetical protein